jgi:hypothetical protein
MEKKSNYQRRLKKAMNKTGETIGGGTVLEIKCKMYNQTRESEQKCQIMLIGQVT